MGAQWIIDLSERLQLPPLVVTRVLESLLIVFLLLALRVLALRVLRRRSEDPERIAAVRRLINTTTLFLAIVLLLREWWSGLWKGQIAEMLALSPKTVGQLLVSSMIVMIMLMIRHVALGIAQQRVSDVRRAFHVRRIINYSVGCFLVVLLLWTWVTGLRESGIGTFLGLLAAGLAVALSDLLANLAGWVFISIRRPYVVGDRVQMGEHLGDVVDIRLFQTFLLECGGWVDADQSTGRIIMVPNGAVFKQPTANNTKGFEYLWDELGVLVTFESDWRRTKELLTEIANEFAQPLSHGAQAQLRRAASKHMIFFRNLTPIVYTSVKDSGVQLSIRYLTPARQRRSSAERIWEAILDAFAKEPSIDLAYPTMRRYVNYIEGKPEAKAPIPPGHGP